ncbi:GNAT family N-acetyltransferase [Chromobacterium sphagni]|nr:GNAT family N-acetyltransferase [Chromobacterium sphagni]
MVRSDDIDTLFEVRAATRENALSREQLAALGITAQGMAEALDSGAVKGWVCLAAERIVGFCLADIGAGEILVLAVLPQHEGRGAGKGLLQRTIAAVCKDRVWLAANPDPAGRAHGFYRACGFLPNGERDEHGDEILVYRAQLSA